MNPRRVCVCCGEAMPEQNSAHSRNPNMCASCSSMADGMDEPGVPPREPPAAEASPSDLAKMPRSEPPVHARE